MKRRALKVLRHAHARKGKRTRTYRAWDNMLSRCYRKSYRQYDDYGGRGIVVCERWRKSFDNFLADMGEAPANKTLDRQNVNGNYEKNNCRWATRVEQARNKRCFGTSGAYGYGPEA
jgi:hypothetical protein